MAENSNSILETVKKLLGSDEYFDQDLIVHINTTFAKLNQIGVGPKEGFAIEDETAVWSDYVTDINVQSMVKSYMVLQVKLLFDVNTASSYLIEEWNKKSAELEWRLNAFVDFKIGGES